MGILKTGVLHKQFVVYVEDVKYKDKVKNKRILDRDAFLRMREGQPSVNLVWLECWLRKELLWSRLF